MSVETITETKVDEFKPTRLDRCDACASSRAYVRVVKNSKDLLFCLHHFSKFEPSLIANEWTIQSRKDIFDAEIEAYNKPREDDNF